MALFRKFFYRKPPDGLLEIAERVYVFDYCFTTDVMGEDEYRFYAGRIVSQLRAHIPDASFMVFNFREGEHQSQIDDILSEYGMTVMDYPRHYEGCPILTLEMIHHFLRSSESWLSLGPQNILLMHCERGGWPVLAFMLAGLLIYRKQFTGEQKTLDMIHKQAPRELLQLLSPLNPLPSQLRYLQYISRRNVGSKWPPFDRALTLDCVMLRTLPNFDGEGGCRPIFRIYGQDPSTSYDRTSKVLFSTQKKSKSVRHYRQADCELVKIDIHCHVQGDVVLECISLDENLRREEMMFRVMFNTAFIRSNILMLNCDEVDILWDAKDRFPKDFRAEVLFSEMDGTASLLAEELVSSKEKEGLPVEAFAKVKEIFNSVEWADGKKGDAALHVLRKQLKSSDLLHEKLESRQKIEFKHLQKPSSHMFEEKVKLAEGANLKITKSPDFDTNDQNSRHTRPKILYQGVPKSRTNPVSSVSSLQNSSIHVSRYHSNAPSALGITALLQDHASFGSSEVAHSVIMSPSAPSLVTVTTSGLSKSASPKIASPHMPLREPKNVSVSSQPSPSQLLPQPLPPPHLQSTIHEISAPQSPTLPSMTLVKPPPQAPPLPPSPPPLPPQLPPPSFSTMFFPSSQSAETQEISASNPLKVTVLTPPPPPPPPSRQGTLVGPFRKSNINSHVHTQPLAPLSPMKRSSAPPPPPPPLRAGPIPSAPPPPPSPMLKHSSSSSLQKPPNVPPTPPPLAHDSFEGPDASSHPPTVMNGSSSAVLGAKVHNFSRIGSRLSTQSSARTASLKPLHWVKVTRAMKGSLWAEAQKSDEASKTPEFDMSELQTLFSAAMPNSDHRGSTDKSSRRSSLGKKPDKVQLIDLRRANNCEIMLTKVKMPLADLMSSILALDDSILEGDQVDNLIKFCPTNEEMDLLKGFGGDRENLGKCEQYFLELMKIPRVESKFRVFSFKIQFCSQVTDLRGNLNIVNSAADEIRHSAKLRRVMQTILSLGNALNQGTARGSAIGFRLDSLLKLTDMRARNNKMTLMHYLCKVIVDKLPELLDFSKDLVSLEAASKIQLKILAEEMQAISKGLEKVEQELTDSENDGAISETFRKTLKEFLGGAEAEVRTLTSLYSNVGRNADALALYFGEDPARCPFEQVISTLFNFVRMFIRAHEENCKQIELEKRRAQKEAENENMKLLTKRKELASSLHLTNKMKCRK